MAKVEDEGLTTLGSDQFTSEYVDMLQRVASDATEGSGSSEGWNSAASGAKAIADGLRTEDARVALGHSSLIESCGTLLRLSVLAGPEALGARTQLLRVIGNMCFDNDENRARTQAAAIPGTIIELLRRLLRLGLSSTGDEHAELDEPKAAWSLDELLFMRAATGALLNMSLSYDPIRDELNTSETLAVLLSLLDSRQATRHGETGTRTTPSVYRIDQWSTTAVDDEDGQAELDAGMTTVTWAMNVLTNVIGDKKTNFPPQGATILAAIVLATPTASSPLPPRTYDPEDAAEYVENDISLLTEAASLLEAVAMDVETVKEELGTGHIDTDRGTLPQLMHFVEKGVPPEHWLSYAEDPTEVQKPFALVKSAVVRAIVEVPNSDTMMNSLFAHGSKSWLVVRLVDWMEKASEDREDLLICASHMLAALARKDEHCISLVQQYGVAAPLAKITIDRCELQLQGPKQGARPAETTQILYGTVNLLRHLSIPLINKLVLGDTGIVGPVSSLLRPELDVVGPLQNAAVGLLKHLAAANVPNSLRLLETDAKLDFEATEAEPDTALQGKETLAPIASSTPIDRILALVSRTDDVRLRSEATRVLVNIVRSLFSTKSLGMAELAAASPITPTLHSSSGSSLDTEEVMKRRGRPRVARREVAVALSEMVRLSERYPLLINEAIVGLTLLAGSGGAGALFVLNSLLERHEKQTASTDQGQDTVPAQDDADKAVSPSSRKASLAVTSAGDPPTAADMLANWLGLCASRRLDRSSTTTSSGVRPEMIGNAAALLITVLRGADVARADKGKLDELRSKILGPLRGCTEAMAEEQNEVLKRTVTRCLEVAAS